MVTMQSLNKKVPGLLLDPLHHHTLTVYLTWIYSHWVLFELLKVVKVKAVCRINLHFQYTQHGPSWTVQATMRWAFPWQMTHPLWACWEAFFWQWYKQRVLQQPCALMIMAGSLNTEVLKGYRKVKTRASGPKVVLWFLLESIHCLVCQQDAWLNAQRHYFNSLYSFADYQFLEDCLI
jgi:hypothetical protein